MEDLSIVGEKRVTIHDVARVTGVSTATVSGAFSGRRRMSEATRNKVLAAAQEMGFRPDPHAQRLSTGRFDNTVALLMQSDLGVATQTMWKLQSLLSERRFEVHDRMLPVYVENMEAQQTTTLQQIGLQNPQAILCQNFDLQSGALKVLRRYVDNGGVLVCWGFVNKPSRCTELVVDHVLLDEEEASFLQASHLIELGHRKLGFYGHGLTINRAKGNFQAGFERALSQHGLECRPEWIGAACCYEMAGVQHAKKFLALKERPTGVCIINDNAASAFIHSVMRAGLRVPADVSVVGHDDTAAAQAAFVPLTTVRRPVDNFALAIVEALCKRLSGEVQGPPRDQVIRGELVIRQSTAAPGVQ
jgi:DNA-binding LacI/PurR family transcriptional regulator